MRGTLSVVTSALYDAGMRLRRRPNDRARSRMSLGLNIVLVLGVAVAATAVFGAGLWLVLGRPPIRQVSGWTTANSFEFAKVVLALVGGAGAVVALVVAYRKQRLGEVADQREDIKLFAERFTKAADQLGSDKAPVRLAGMYALKDLGQGTPSQRQTIVNVLCAYLRMPYLPPVPRDLIGTGDVSGESETPSSAGDQVFVAAMPTSPVDRPENERRHQERQVRLTAQRILAAHLRPGEVPEHPVDTYWKGIDLDLTGATLLEFDLSKCQIQAARFGQAEFGGNARLDGAVFFGDVGLDRAVFGEDVSFNGAVFGGLALCDGAEFGGSASFDGATFKGDVKLDAAGFGGEVRFDRAVFGGDVSFDAVAFGGFVSFDGAEFGGSASFDGATFNGDIRFGRAVFGGDVSFDGAEFGGFALFGEAKFDEFASFEGTGFNGDAKFDGAEFGGFALFGGIRLGGARFGGNVSFAEAKFQDASFDGVRVRLDIRPRHEQVWPEGLGVVEPPAGDVGQLPDREGRWGYLTSTNTSEDSPTAEPEA
ncbi:pentapeptide repeat-containing protein [Lentzea indica]|uniref:pentapeptide repeat-containing protein n=1 Tax=Lentzea indica TaxID=2604800 RepID=UPI0028A76D14|nr:pentapeptide repeat-containing protein [Lentzea indica]